MQKKNTSQAQKKIFLRAEGDAYFKRNQGALAKLAAEAPHDPVVEALERSGVKPRSILEIGCSTGWRLAYLQKKFGAECHGVDPSGDAIRAGLRRHPRLQLRRGTADRLPFGAGQFDLVIFGFCLYLCDRSDLFKIACEADRVLQNNGHLALLDFAPPLPYRNEYQHQPGLCSYKMDYAAMFTWNPAYVPIYHIKISHGGAQGVQAPNDRVGASVLLKRGTEEYPQVVWPA